LGEYLIIISLVGGALAGAALAWLFARQRAAAAHAEKDAAVAEKEATLRAEFACTDGRAREEHAREKLELSTRLATAEANAASNCARLAEFQSEITAREQMLGELRGTKGNAEARIASLETQLADERQQAAEKLALLQDAQKQLTTQFEALSYQALQKNNEAFLALASTKLGEVQEKAAGELAKKEQAITELLKPVRDSLARVDGQITEMEKARAGAYEGLLAQVRSLGETQQQLRGETGRLASALRSSGARGRWGEIQLRRVVELAGMQDHCDFYEQQSVAGENGRLRPDMLVKMPGGKTIVVDSKVPFNAYDRAISATDDVARNLAYREHAVAVREHIRALAGKSYSEQFEEAPEFVVLFLPAETFFGAAVEHDPELIEFSAEKNVMLTTPMTLIALLRAVHYGWRQEKLTENAKQISDLGRELYDRLATMGDHMAKLGKHLDNAVDSFNKAAGSLETRVLVSARRFKELQAAAPDKEMRPLDQIEHTTRSLQAPELQLGMEA
jgi:DNA recombination protein RmuC